MVEIKSLPLHLIISAGGMVVWGIVADSLAITTFGLIGFIFFGDTQKESSGKVEGENGNI